jgi:NRAMP (natural resistance-associated macrophage protein)-like metal ion transporter
VSLSNAVNICPFFPSNNIPRFSQFSIKGKYIYNEYGIITQVFWAIGLLAAGQCSTMTGTYSGQFVMEGFTKISLTKWKRILIIRSLAILIAVPIALLALGSIDQLNFWCNIIQAVQLPFALLPILHFTASKRIMGQFRMNW